MPALSRYDLADPLGLYLPPSDRRAVIHFRYWAPEFPTAVSVVPVSARVRELKANPHAFAILFEEGANHDVMSTPGQKVPGKRAARSRGIR